MPTSQQPLNPCMMLICTMIEMKISNTPYPSLASFLGPLLCSSCLSLPSVLVCSLAFCSPIIMLISLGVGLVGISVDAKTITQPVSTSELITIRISKTNFFMIQIPSPESDYAHQSETTLYLILAQ